jgi:hypothetical protein
MKYLRDLKTWFVLLSICGLLSLGVRYWYHQPIVTHGNVEGAIRCTVFTSGQGWHKQCLCGGNSGYYFGSETFYCLTCKTPWKHTSNRYEEHEEYVEKIRPKL